jgi:hypothetical protein
MKKQQYLHINSVTIEYLMSDISHSESVVFHCQNLTRQTCELPIISKRFHWEDQIVIPVKFTEMITVDVRYHTDNHSEKQF